MGQIWTVYNTQISLKISQDFFPSFSPEWDPVQYKDWERTWSMWSSQEDPLITTSHNCRDKELDNLLQPPFVEKDKRSFFPGLRLRPLVNLRWGRYLHLEIYPWVDIQLQELFPKQEVKRVLWVKIWQSWCCGEQPNIVARHHCPDQKTNCKATTQTLKIHCHEAWGDYLYLYL